MAKLQRKTQKIFCGTANADQIAVFGTMKTGSPQYSNDVETLQSSTYEEGWSDAILEDKAPYLEEMNGVQYGLSYQTAYILQEGIPEYDDGTEYSNSSIVKAVDVNNNIVLYHSIQSENIGNPLTDNSNWQRLYITDVGYIGQPQITFNFNQNVLPDNCIWLEGQELSRILYAGLFNIYGTTYGAGDGATTFNVPDCRNRVFWGGTTAGYIDAALPNIVGRSYYTADTRKISSSAGSAINEGALYRRDYGTGHSQTVTGTGTMLCFDASLSSNIYKNDINTVQPPAVKCRVFTRYQ